MQNKRIRNNLWLIIGFVLLWNSGFIGAEFGLPYAGTFTFLFWRYLALSIILFFYLLVNKQLQWDGWRYAAPKMLVGVLAHGVWLSCVLIAIDHGVPAGIVALIVALQPMATGALSGWVTGESTPWHRWVGLVIGFIGVAVPVISHVDFNDVADVVAWFIPLGSVIAITAATLIQRRLSLQKNRPKIRVAKSLFYQSIATTFAMVIPAIIWEGLEVQWNSVFVSAIIWLVLGVSLGAYALMWLLVNQLRATRVASLFYLGPPVTMIMAWLAFGDQVQKIDLVGLVLVFIGVLVTNIKTKEKG